MQESPAMDEIKSSCPQQVYPEMGNKNLEAQLFEDYFYTVTPDKTVSNIFRL